MNTLFRSLPLECAVHGDDVSSHCSRAMGSICSCDHDGLTALNASLGAANTSLEEQVAFRQAEHSTQVQALFAECDSLLAQVADLVDKAFS